VISFRKIANLRQVVSVSSFRWRELNDDLTYFSLKRGRERNKKVNPSSEACFLTCRLGVISFSVMAKRESPYRSAASGDREVLPQLDDFLN
jgi:hypothetical protein